MHFGMPKSVLEAHGIDIEIMYQLPEDLRAEQLSMIDFSRPNQN
jgi:hypothetical protein